MGDNCHPREYPCYEIYGASSARLRIKTQISGSYSSVFILGTFDRIRSPAPTQT